MPETGNKKGDSSIRLNRPSFINVLRLTF